MVSWCLGDDDIPVSPVDVTALLHPAHGAGQHLAPRALKRTIIRVLAWAHVHDVRRALVDGIAEACAHSVPLLDRVRYVCPTLCRGAVATEPFFNSFMR